MFSDIKAFLISFWKNIRSKKFIKKFMGLIIICILTVLIPLSIAICYVQYVQNEQKNATPSISVSLFSSDGKLIESDTIREDIIDTSPFASLFYDLSTLKVKVQKPAEFSRKQSLNFTLNYGTETSSFKCYFEENVGSSYIEDKNGTFYIPNAEVYSRFLNSSYSEIVYKESIPPTLYTPLNDEIMPTNVDWSYKLNNGKERKSENYELTQKISTYRIAGAIDFTFSRTPNICNITVKTLSGDTIFSGSLDKLSLITAEENTELNVTVYAKWEKDNTYSSYGEEQYEFKILCSEPSSFQISATEAIGGELLLLTVSNVDNVDSIIYSPESKLSNEIQSSNDSASNALSELYAYKPIFAKKGSNAYALFPIPADIPYTTFKFSISCGISKATLTLNLKENSAKNDATADDISFISAQKAEFSRILFYLKHSTRDTLLLSDKFLFPTDYGFTQTYKFNDRINNSFNMLANSYSSSNSNGVSVKSANIGTVSQVGYSPLLGNYVIVDHGMGLLTWYCGLSDTSVNENDIVKKGDPIGRAGSSSLLCENGVNIICSVGGILIDPDTIK